MKNLILSIALVLTLTVSFAQPKPQITVENKEFVISDSLKSELKNEALALLQDSLFRAELYTEIQNEYENKPESESSIWTWIIWILSSILTILGMFIAKMPTTSTLWYLQPIQVIIRFVLNNVLAPKNLNEKGTEHKI